MKPFKCRQCRAEIAFINGPHKFLDCPNCGKRNRVYTNSKGIRLVIKAALILICSLNVFGQDRVLVNLVNFQDDQRQPFTVDHARIQTEIVKAFFLEQSFGQKDLTFEFTEWVTLAMPATCDTQAIAAATGVDLTAYRHVVYAFPKNYTCGWSGTSTLGGKEFWLNTDRFGPEPFSHELGHNLGLGHSRAYDCNSMWSSVCTSIEYGDVFDTMGATAPLMHFNLLQKERAGWVQVPEIATSGVYYITPLETLGGGYKVKFGTGWLYFEKRIRFGFDLVLNDDAVNGVIVHYVIQNRSWLLDASPETDSFYDSPLMLGETFSSSGLSVTVNGINEGAEIGVTVPSSTLSPTPTPIPTCQRFNPRGKCLKYN